MTAETTLTVVPLTDQTKRELRNAGKRATSAVEKRDALIRWAVSVGGSYREVGEAVGLSHTAVAFIARGRRAQQEEEGEQG